MPGRLKFSYWSDPLCIWALVAQQELDRVLAELGEHVRVDYRIVPVFGSVPWRFAQGPWSKDGVEGRVLATRRIAEQGGRADADRAPAATVSARSEDPLQKREADATILAGVGIGMLGLVTAAIGGTVCPVCVIAAPALVGVGAFRRWRSARR